jgi:hypothetical protein
LVVFTVTPTLYIAVTAWRVNRPSHVREVEAQISHEFGLKVSLEGVRHPRPGEDVLRGVLVRQEEPRARQLEELARAATVRVIRNHDALVLEVDGLLLRAESPKQAMAQVSALLQRVGAGAYPHVSLSAPTCEVDLGPGGTSGPMRYRFHDVAGVFQSNQDAPTITVSYRPDDEGSSTRCELTLTRNRQGAKVRTSLVFKTMEGLPLPARVLDPFFDTADWLGSAARAEGTLALIQQGQSDWEAEFEGVINDVDFAALLSHRFPDQRLSGMGLVKISKARWANRPGGQGFGWVTAEGELRAGQGAIGANLLQALKDEMQFRLPPGLESRHGDIPFQSLGLTFALAADGEIRLRGGLGTEYPPDAVLVDADRFGPLASAPEGTANVRGLIRTLFPTTGANPTVLVPDTPESRILRFLPAPVTTAQRAKLIAN